MRKSLLIAVDFDGTIVEDKYPSVGKAKPFAIETLKMLQEDGHRLILWTYRYGSKLQDAVDFMVAQGVAPYAVNRSYPEEDAHPSDVSRKIHADLFIDDRNFGGFPGWGEIYQKLNKDGLAPSKTKKTWFGLKR
jgi:hypothetical protein